MSLFCTFFLINLLMPIIRGWQIDIKGNFYASDKTPAVVTCQADESYTTAQLNIAGKAVVTISDIMNNGKFVGSVLAEFRDKVTVKGDVTNVEFTMEIALKPETMKDIYCSANKQNKEDIKSKKVQLLKRVVPTVSLVINDVFTGSKICLKCEIFGGGKVIFIFPDENQASSIDLTTDSSLACWKSTVRMNGRVGECRQDFTDGEQLTGKTDAKLIVKEIKDEDTQKPTEPDPKKDEGSQSGGQSKITASQMRTEIVSWLILAVIILVFAIVLASACIGVFTFFNTQ